MPHISLPSETQRWDSTDYAEMSWHDNVIYSIAFPGPSH